jgi:type I restriction enzyme S subunit
MNEWKEVRLGELAEVQTGPFGSQLHAADYVMVGTPSIMPTNIGARLNVTRDNLMLVSDEDIKRLNKYTVKETDIVYSRRGDVEKCAYITKNENGWLCGTGCLRIRFTSPSLNPKFCGYYLSTNEIKSWLLNNAVGSTMPNLNSTILAEVPLMFPPLPEQQAIAEVLSSIDDKIDLLNRNNKTLEEMAETLFRKWFVEGANENIIDEISIENLCKVLIGRTPPRQQHEWFSTPPTGISWISIKDLGNCSTFISETSESLTEEAVTRFNIPLIPENTVVLSFKLTVGRVAITMKKMLSNEAIAQFQISSESAINSMFLYSFLKTFNFQSLGSTSSIAEAVNSKMIKEIPCPVPHRDSLMKFTKTSEPLFEKIKANAILISKLVDLRDTLLPKLMSGQVRVGNN